MTSYAALQRLSGSPDGFGGDLRYGQKDGLAGADEMGPPDPNNPTVGSGGGYGAIYCFALTP